MGTLRGPEASAPAPALLWLSSRRPDACTSISIDRSVHCRCFLPPVSPVLLSRSCTCICHLHLLHSFSIDCSNAPPEPAQPSQVQPSEVRGPGPRRGTAADTSLFSLFRFSTVQPSCRPIDLLHTTRGPVRIPLRPSPAGYNTTQSLSFGTCHRLDCCLLHSSNTISFRTPMPVF